MLCPKCGLNNSKVYDTRMRKNKRYRRYKCLSCGHKFTTYEQLEINTKEQEDWVKFFKLRERIFDKIKKVDEGYHKSYEGSVDVRFNFQNIYEAKDIKDIAFVEIELHCYLLVDGRHITFEGKTFREALDKFESWLSDEY